MRAGLFIVLFTMCDFLAAQEFQSSHNGIDMSLSGNYLIQANKNASILGSPFLKDEFGPGSILSNNQWFENTILKFDIYNGYFVIKLSNGEFIIDPDKTDVDTIKYNGEIFVRLSKEVGNKAEITFVSLLAEQNGYSLCKQYRNLLTEAIKEVGYQEAKPAEYKNMPPIYYVSKDPDTWEIRGINSISEIFDVATKTVKPYLKKNKYKITNEDDLIAVFNYFSQKN